MAAERSLVASQVNRSTGNWNWSTEASLVHPGQQTTTGEDASGKGCARVREFTRNSTGNSASARWTRPSDGSLAREHSSATSDTASRCKGLSSGRQVTNSVALRTSWSPGVWAWVVLTTSCSRMPLSTAGPGVLISSMNGRSTRCSRRSSFRGTVSAQRCTAPSRPSSRMVHFTVTALVSRMPITLWTRTRILEVSRWTGQRDRSKSGISTAGGS
mmetsp:Transcript_30646/g.69121  ORF Transcript_30646/g.69121 Transcript_30646/m.69121 type:complete len:215 (-) Transcript_30646:114-758(-)